MGVSSSRAKGGLRIGASWGLEQGGEVTRRHSHFSAFHHQSCLCWAQFRPLLSLLVCFLRLCAEKGTVKSHRLHLTCLGRLQTNAPLLFAVCWCVHFVWSTCTSALGTRSKTTRNGFAVDWACLAKYYTLPVPECARDRERKTKCRPVSLTV